MQPYNFNYNYGNPYMMNNMGQQQQYLQRLQMLEQQNQPYMNSMQQQPYGQVMPQSSSLQGKIVDSIEVVRATDVDMTGAVTYFPQSDGQAIYTKQLQPDGRSKVETYIRVEDNNTTNQQNNYNIDNLINNFQEMRLDLSNQIAELKAMVSPPVNNVPNVRNKEVTK